MKPPKHIFFDNVLSVEECKHLETKYLQFIKDGWKGNPYDNLSRENQTQISLSHPYSNLEIDESGVADRLTILLQKNYSEKIKYSHSYMRLYKKNSVLPLHTDRKGLDLTLSVNVGGIESWSMQISNIFCKNEIPIHSTDCENKEIEKFKKDYSTFLTPRGSGVACYAYHFPHWRDKLICKRNEYVMQIFYHWTTAKYFTIGNH